jgi:benzodiazapine receptor
VAPEKLKSSSLMSMLRRTATSLPKRVTALQLGNVLAFLSVLVVNALAGGTRLLGGKNTADVSAAYPTLITPAGFTFSIWGVIYLLLLAFVVFQLSPGHRRDPFNRQVGGLFILSSAFNIAWLFLWQYEYIVASVPLIFGLLATLVAIYVRLGVRMSKASLREKLSVHLAFSVYLGWITVASLADLSSALVAANWDGFGISTIVWGQLFIIIAVAVAFLVLVLCRDLAYGLVIVWALAGIASNQGAHPEVGSLAFAGGAGIVVAVLLLGLVQASRRPRWGRKSESLPT